MIYYLMQIDINLQFCQTYNINLFPSEKPMGNCCSWSKGYNETSKDLQKLYKQKYKYTIFYQILKNIIKEQNLSDLNQQLIQSKKSLIDSQIYENDRIILAKPGINDSNNQINKGRQQSTYVKQGKYGKQGKRTQESIEQIQSDQQTSKAQKNNNCLPSRFSNLSEIQKKTIVIQLIKKSYLLLDMSDIFSEEKSQLKAYESHVKHQIFKNDQSLIFGSFADIYDDSNLVNALKTFDIDTVIQLQNYVKICERIQATFQIQEQNYGYYQKNMGSMDNFLCILMVRLKSKVIQQYNITLAQLKQQQKINDHPQILQQLFYNTKNMIQILQDTVSRVFNIRYKQEDKKPQSSQQQQSKNSINFLNQVNFNTLISSIVFGDDKFHQFYLNSIKECLKNRLKRYKEMNKLGQRDIIKMLRGNGNSPNANLYRIRPNIENLFDASQNKSKKEIREYGKNPFYKSIKIFNKIISKNEPILKLKVLGETQKQFMKEYQKISEEENLPQLIFDRNISQFFSKWLLNRQKQGNFDVIASIILCYIFIHHEYRIRGKGSILTSYLAQVQDILGWTIPII